MTSSDDVQRSGDLAADEVTALARRIVERELRETSTTARHVPVGHSNTVVKVEVEGGHAFAVRMSKLDAARFEMEAAVMHTVAEAGVAVPAVRFIGRATDAGTPRS